MKEQKIGCLHVLLIHYNIKNVILFNITFYFMQ